ncbi:imm11 family protein [Flectobacillus roseus]|uniref:Immunity protein 43 domain-containing protein n=1 Tax=Flectobacillus roseus TaxID=502259 RepID=A0ABT6Y3J5_9BACT|nr:DUF1629 domain-containing protein [Flectobacillus roseus]MDI9858142.1 hypothetical protein [Flectobacillus roseus]
MKYYIFAPSMNKKVVGHYHQTEDVVYPIELYKPPYSGKFTKGEFLDFNPEVQIILHKKAFLTDFIDGSPLGFGIFLNDKVKELLKGFHLPPHKYHPIKVMHKGEQILGYYWLHFFVDLYQFIDREMSFYELIDQSTKKVSLKGKIESEGQMYQIFKKYGGDFRINIEYCFKSQMPKYDLFANNIHVGYKYMSEKLVDMIKEKQITGYDFVEAKNLFFEIEENG